WPRVLGPGATLERPQADLCDPLDDHHAGDHGRATRPLDHVDLLMMAARAHSIGADRARGDVLLIRALDELNPETEPRRVAIVLARHARIQWALNRGLEGLKTAQRALDLLGDDESDPERAALLG